MEYDSQKWVLGPGVHPDSGLLDVAQNQPNPVMVPSVPGRVKGMLRVTRNLANTGVSGAVSFQPRFGKQHLLCISENGEVCSLNAFIGFVLFSLQLFLANVQFAIWGLLSVINQLLKMSSFSSIWPQVLSVPSRFVSVLWSHNSVQSDVSGFSFDVCSLV